MTICIVGAGAVGVTYAFHMKAEIVFLVREKYAASVREGIWVYRGKKRERLIPKRVITRFEDIGDVDQIWLAIPTTGMNEADLTALARSTGSKTVVDLMPDVDGRARKIIGADRVVEGTIPLVAYQTPIPGEAPRDPGIAYWLPPGATVAFAGARAKEAAAVLRMRTKVVADLGASRAYASAILMCVIWQIEAAGWSIKKGMRAYDAAAREAMSIAERETGKGAGLMRLAVQPWLMRLAFVFAPHFAPFPLEPYIRFHFSKVGEQSHSGLRKLLAKADAYGLAVPHLRALAAKLSITGA